MGTNYYLVEPNSPPCEHCLRPYPVVEHHIGKSSAGWVFSFHSPEGGPKTVAQWRTVIAECIDRGGHIRDEYNAPCSQTEFWEFVERKKTSPRSQALEHPRNDTWYRTWMDEGCSFSTGEFS